MTAMQVKTLGDHVELLSGFAFASEHFTSSGEGIPLVRIRDVVRGYSETRYTGDYDPAYLVDDGDILIGMDGEFNAASWKGGKALLNQRVCRIKPRSTLDERYMLHLLPLALKKIESETPFVTVKHLSSKTIKQIPIVLPLIQEQRRIAAILDQAEALRNKRRQAVSKLDSLPASAFLELFGDPQLNRAGWRTCDLGSLIADGPQNGLYRPAEDYGTGTPILRIDAFYDGKVTSMASLRRLRLPQEEISRYGLTEGDIVINRVNSLEYLGKSAIIPAVPEPTVFESNMMRFRVDPARLDGVFLMELLQTSFIKRQILTRSKNAVNQSSINQSDVQSLTVIVPPLDLQRRFRQIALAAAARAATYKRSQDSIDSLFSSLQSEAFRSRHSESNGASGCI